jgi:hypothetical protein
MATKQVWNGKRNDTSNRDATFFTNRWVEILKADNIEESTTLEIEKTLKGYRPLQKDFQNRLRTGIEKRHRRRNSSILQVPSITFFYKLNLLSKVLRRLFCHAQR